MSKNLLTVQELRFWKESRPLLAVTAYDYAMARHLDEAGVDILHVGDSLGMVVLGHETTTQVTMSDMLRSTAAVAKARKRAYITADLPYQSYRNAEEAVRHSRLLIEAGADAVKMEGGEEIGAQIRAVLADGIELQGHLGLLPQHILEEGSYKKKGKVQEEITLLLSNAQFLENVGAFSIILEAVVSEVAHRITQSLKIPTIGIASGNLTRGQIHVCTDLLGLTPWWQFPHVKPKAQLGYEIQQCVRSYLAESYRGL